LGEAFWAFPKTAFHNCGAGNKWRRRDIEMKTENTTPRAEATGSGMKRITADFSPEAYEVLNDTAKQLSISKAEALRKALGLINFVIRQQKEGWTLILEKGDKRKEVVTL
jgi:hypothetical protein